MRRLRKEFCAFEPSPRLVVSRFAVAAASKCAIVSDRCFIELCTGIMEKRMETTMLTVLYKSYGGQERL